ncbi:MAG TPA: DinB family protein [Candidatus Limnocylindrales bacterium]
MAFDPIAEPDAYRRSLLAELGDDDPATAQAATPAALRALVTEAGDRLRVRPEPGEWSALECIGHIVDGELVSSARYRWIVAEEQPDLIGYDQALWVAALHHDEVDPAILLSMFEGLRAANLDLWTRLPLEGRARFGLHRERGPESYELTFRMIAGHDRVHLRQAGRALAAASAAATGRPH